MNGTIYVGIDETNHGNSEHIQKGDDFLEIPEIFVGVFSFNYWDVTHSQFRKKRDSGYNPLKRLGGRDYRFSLLNKEEQLQIPYKDLEGEVASSLIYPFSNPQTRFELYFDGRKKMSSMKHTKEMISDLCKIPGKNLSITSGGSLDEIFYIVNLADSVAYYLLKKEHLRKNNQKEVRLVKR